MGDIWDDDFEFHFQIESDVIKRYHAFLYVQFLKAAWFLRIVPDVYFKFVRFNDRCKELNIELPDELEKSLPFEVGIEIISPKYGTLHIFGPADYEISMHQVGKYYLTKPSIRLEGTLFDEVLGIVSNLQEIYLDKYFGEIRDMHQSGYTQDRHISLYDARKLETLSLVFEAWHLVLQESLKPDTFDNFRTYAHLDAGLNNELYGKIYLPGREDMHETCLILQDEPLVDISYSDRSESSRMFLKKLALAAQNPHRP